MESDCAFGEGVGGRLAQLRALQFEKNGLKKRDERGYQTVPLGGFVFVMCFPDCPHVVDKS